MTATRENSGSQSTPGRRAVGGNTPSGHAWREFATRGRKVRFGCVVCQTMAVCAHDQTPLEWSEDQWRCPKCGDEWSEDSFGSCVVHGGPQADPYGPTDPTCATCGDYLDQDVGGEWTHVAEDDREHLPVYVPPAAESHPGRGGEG